MAESLHVLGQATPGAGSLVTLYTVPASTSTVVSTITVCNQNSSSIKYRISVAIAGAADTPTQYLAYDTTLPKNAFVALTLGLTLATTDVIRVRSDTANVSFNAFGSEVT
jgi:hypothetical protein